MVKFKNLRYTVVTSSIENNDSVLLCLCSNLQAEQKRLPLVSGDVGRPLITCLAVVTAFVSTMETAVLISRVAVQILTLQQ